MSRSKSSRLNRVSTKCRDRNLSLGFEPLEKREMLSSIVWTNRGEPGDDSDLFGVLGFGYDHTRICAALKFLRIRGIAVFYRCRNVAKKFGSGK